MIKAMRELRDEVLLIGPKGSKPVKALFDTGSTYGYVKRDIAEDLGMFISEEEDDVKLPNNQIIKMNPAMCEVEVKGCRKRLWTYVTNDGLSDMVLGMLQMEALGIKIDTQKGYTVSCEIPRA